MAVVESLPFVGKYLYLPRGPVFQEKEGDILSLRKELLRIAKKHEASWIRVEPGSQEMLEILETSFCEMRVVKAPHDTQPKESLMLDISPSQEEILGSMKSKTRYNVRLAEKSGVVVRFSHANEDLEKFITLVYATGDRKNIFPHSKEYYRNFFKAFDENTCLVALAEKEGTVLAGSLLVFFRDVAYYLHGGSADEKRELMAPFLLHFRSIEESRRRGAKRYDFGGVKIRSKKNAKDTGWEGITRFKQGFAPKAETLLFPGTYDIVISSSRYRLYQLLRLFQRGRTFLRRLLRR